ncbi:unnamed protein product [Symbiodinium sp. CCMP2592]|nr:unnamed protein product [Symbiodinium sp. CCMP2592]
MSTTTFVSAESKKKGLLQGLPPDQAHMAGTELYKPELTLEDLFGEDVPSGSALLDQVLAVYGDGHIDVPWFAPGENGKQMIRTIVRSPLSRELQLSTVEAYKNRILAESISQVAAGEPVFKFRSSARQWPIEAGTWNHRVAAVYAAAEEDTEKANHNIQTVLKRGLVSVKVVHPMIPPAIWRRFIITHNLFHSGSGSNFLDYLEDSLRLESEWELTCSQTGLHSQSAAYRNAYRNFVLAKSCLVGRVGTYGHRPSETQTHYYTGPLLMYDV